MHKAFRRYGGLLTVLVLCLSQVCPAQDYGTNANTASQPGQQSGRHSPPPTAPNGISVSRPKVFDNRTLTLMLESLSESLRNMQFVDQKALAAAFNFLQGSRTSEVVSNLSVSTLPVPGFKQEAITNTGNVSSGGAALPDTTKTTTTTNRDVVTPQPPALDTLPTFSGFTPTYGENPSDLLSDQVNLSYQIFNLRMLLERSLTDRLLTGGEPRRQAVLGFNVTLDPPKTAQDSVAVVEITLSLPPGTGDGLSLVSLMPQEKTYNAAALSTKSHAFSGAAVAKIVQVGYSERRRGQTFYLYRDNDTVSYERMNSGNPDQIVFGWMFRPVLGRRSVSPGLRQLFAIAALPANDRMGASQGGQSVKLRADVRTYWKKYDHDTMTSFEERDANRASRFKYALSLLLTKPEIFSSRYTNTASYTNIEVKSTEDYQQDLRPEVKRISWRTAGPKLIVISAEGNNFFTGTQVNIGDKAYTGPADGLVIKSNQAFDLTTTLDALANGPGAIIGRYGPAVPLTLERCPPGGAGAAANGGGCPGVPQGGIEIEHTEVSESPFAGNRLLDIYLKSLDGAQPLTISGLPQDLNWGAAKPVVTINGNVVTPPYKFVDLPGAGVLLQANVPDSFVGKDGGIVRVSYPFLPEEWTASKLISNPNLDFQLTRVSGSTILIHTRSLLGFTRKLSPGQNGTSTMTAPSNYCWQILVGGQLFNLANGSCTNPDAGTRNLSDADILVKQDAGIPDKIFLISPEHAVFALDVPKGTPDPPPTPKVITLNQFDAAWIDIAVEDSSKVAAVEVNQVTLRPRRPPDENGKPAKSIQVPISRELTAKPGELDITLLDADGKPLLDKDGKLLVKTRLRITCRVCDIEGGKQ